MPSNVPSIKPRKFDFSKEAKQIEIPAITQFVGLSSFPGWFLFNERFEDNFSAITEYNTGGILVSELSYPWDMHPGDFLRMLQPTRSPYSAKLWLSEIVVLLSQVRNGLNGREVPENAGSFIVQNCYGEMMILAIKWLSDKRCYVESLCELTYGNISTHSPVFIPTLCN